VTRALALLTTAARGRPVAPAVCVTLARAAIAAGLHGVLALAVLDARAQADDAATARAGVELAAALVAADAGEDDDTGP
jgi:hypothetical protein